MNSAHEAANIIFIRNLRIKMNIGIFTHEKKRPQYVMINATITLDPKIRWSKDDIKETIPYDGMVRDITDIAGQRHFNLIENFLETLADKILSYDKIKSVKISAGKPKIFKNSELVGIEITRQK